MALIDKASLLMVPSTYEAGKLYNVLPSGNRAPDSTDQNSGYDQTRADFDFDRGSNAAATRIGSDGLIKKYRENLFTESNNFSDSDWTKAAGGSFTSGQPDKDGGTDAWKFNSTTAANSGAWQNVTLSGVATFSAYFKKGTLDKIAFVNFAGNSYECYFDLENGVIEQQTGDLINAKIEAVGTDGWYRCSITDIASGTNYLQLKPTDNLSGTATQSGYIYIQNAQLESGLVSTDYLESTSVTGKAGVLVDLPRINYDANGENGALLLEPSRANLVAYSEYFGSYSKVTSDATAVPVVTDNYAISPEGVNNAARVVVTKPGTDNDYAVIREAKTVTKTSGDKMAQSVYLKATDATQVGKILDIYAYDGSYLSVTNHTLTSDWKRVEVIHTASTGTSNTEMVIGKARGWAGGTTLANMATDFLVYGHQFENGASYATSYIPTMGTSETRAADSCSVTGVSDVIGQTEGTLFLDLNPLEFADASRYLSIESSSGAGSGWIGIFAASPDIFRIYGDGFDSNFGGYSVGDRAKIALTYKNGVATNIYINGVNKGSVTANTTGKNYSILKLGYAIIGGVGAGEFNQCTIFSTALSDSEAQTLTTL